MNIYYLKILIFIILKLLNNFISIEAFVNLSNTTCHDLSIEFVEIWGIYFSSKTSKKHRKHENNLSRGGWESKHTSRKFNFLISMLFLSNDDEC